LNDGAEGTRRRARQQAPLAVIAIQPEIDLFDPPIKMSGLMFASR
jgi:hypothetical protein